MLGIGCPDRHALPRIMLSKMRRPRRVLPSRASGFVRRPFPDIRPGPYEGGTTTEFSNGVSDPEAEWSLIEAAPLVGFDRET
jgi:hypothetical protein